MSNQLVRRSGGGLVRSRVERRAGQEIEQFRAQGAVIGTRQYEKAAVIGDVTRCAIQEFGDVAITAEIVAQRTPAFTPEVVGIARQGAAALGRVVAETERLW